MAIKQFKTEKNSFIEEYANVNILTLKNEVNETLNIKGGVPVQNLRIPLKFKILGFFPY